MFKQVEIKNFQSHKDSKLNLSEGINLFVGNSDCGKSAVMRSLLWAITNKPSGDSFVSNAIKDAKGNVKGECSVSIDGVARIKGKGFNGYKADGETFEALRTDVPETIAKKFNISDVNIQRQLDGPFLLSNTPGENAKYINSLVNLEVIDSAVNWVGAKTREAKASKKFICEELDSLASQILPDEKEEGIRNILGAVPVKTKHIEKLEDRERNLVADLASWEYLVNHTPSQELVDKLAEIATRIEAVVNSVSQKEIEAGHLTDELLQYDSALKNLPDESKVEELAGIVEKIADAKVNVSRLEPETNNLAGTLAQYDRELMNGLPDESKVAQLEELLKKIAVTKVAEEQLLGQSSWLDCSLRDYKNCQDELMYLEPGMASLETELSTMACPLCGRKGCNHEVNDAHT